MRSKLDQKGVTILELMIVAAAIGVIAAMAVPRFGSVMERLKLKTAGRDVVSSLRLARSNAVSQRDQYGVYFDYSANQYVLFRDSDDPSSFTYDPLADSVIIAYDLPGNIHLGYVSFPNVTVVFRPNGSAQASGQAAVYSYEEGGAYETMTVDVLGSTGRVKLIEGAYYTEGQ
jgi:prepilin-type N-terminal cleavage/methylation domain-containing protein